MIKTKDLSYSLKVLNKNILIAHLALACLAAVPAPCVLCRAVVCLAVCGLYIHQRISARQSKHSRSLLLGGREFAFMFYFMAAEIIFDSTFNRFITS